MSGPCRQTDQDGGVRLRKLKQFRVQGIGFGNRTVKKGRGTTGHPSKRLKHQPGQEPSRELPTPRTFEGVPKTLNPQASSPNPKPWQLPSKVYRC